MWPSSPDPQPGASGTPDSGEPGGLAAGPTCVLGDAHLDVVVLVAEPVAEETDTPARTFTGAGGQAANVAAWITALGGRARLIAARGTDLAGRLVVGDLTSRGVDLAGPVIEGRTGVVVSLSHGGRARSMLTDRGVGPLLSAGALDEGWFDGCTWLHLPAYSLLRKPIRGAALAAAERLPRLSVDLSSTSAVREYGADRFRELLARLRPQVVFGTEAEAALVGDVAGCEMVVKLGPRGVRAGGVVHPAQPADAVDSTGAGDAFAAGYLLGGVSLGLAAAARAVAKIGAMP
jgi:ribokinase